MASIIADKPEISVGMGDIQEARAPQKLATVLGSCIGVVIYHPRFKIASLAHVVLPYAEGRQGTKGKFADTAIPTMMRSLSRLGLPDAGREAKLAGGSNMFGGQGPIQIGNANLEAVLQQLKLVNVRVIGQHVGGNAGRRISFDPESRVMTVCIQGRETVCL